MLLKEVSPLDGDSVRLSRQAGRGLALGGLLSFSVPHVFLVNTGHIPITLQLSYISGAGELWPLS